MTRTFVLILSAVASIAVAQSAFAQQWTPELVNAQQACYAEANRIDFSGEKAGYAVAYRAAVDDCLSRGTGRYEGYHPSKYRARASITGNCPPGAPILYRGTLYCR